MCDPDGENATSSVGSVWPLKICKDAPVQAQHTFTIQSRLGKAICPPHNDTAICSIPRLRRSQTGPGSQVEASKIRTVPSSLPVKMRSPSVETLKQIPASVSLSRCASD